jgi:hypothetical protein
MGYKALAMALHRKRNIEWVIVVIAFVTVVGLGGCTGADRSDAQRGARIREARNKTEVGLALDITPAERRKLDRLLQQRQQDATRRKRIGLAESAKALDAVTPYPGSRLVHEWRNPSGNVTTALTRQEQLFDDYAAAVLPVEKYLELTETSWGIERDFLAPKKAGKREIWKFFTSHIAGNWTLTMNHRYPGPSHTLKNAPGAYELRYSKGRRCLTIRIGVNEPEAPGAGRGIELVTYKPTRSGC